MEQTVKEVLNGELEGDAYERRIICKQILEVKGIIVSAHINSIGKIKDCSFLESDISDELLNSFKEKELPLINTKLEDEMRQEILSTRSSGDLLEEL